MTLPVDKLESLLELVNEFGRTSEEVGRADMHVGYDPGRHYKNEECDDAKKQLVEAINRLCSSATAAEKDAARLDWLDSLGFTAYCNRDPETRERGHVVFVNEDAKGARKGIVRQTIREAIDQAMGEANGR